MEYKYIEGTIKLYNNQVFIADNIKEVIPEFLMLLKGVIDLRIFRLTYQEVRCRMMDLSIRLQTTFRRKWQISFPECAEDRIVRTMRNLWDDISPFIKFGCLKDEKFCDR